MKVKIETLEDLRSEIIHLELQCAQQEEVISFHINSVVERLASPFKMLQKVSSWFGAGDGKDKKESHDWLSNTFFTLLPIALDKVFFRKSGFLVKTLATFAAQNAANFITKDAVWDVVHSVAEWMKNIRSKVGKDDKFNFGVPPDSEAS